MTQSGPPQGQTPGSGQDGGRGDAQGQAGASGPGPAAPAATGQQPSWQQSLTSTTAMPGPAGLFYADVPNRIIAYIIDVIALAIVGFFVALVLGGLFGGVTSASGEIGVEAGELNVGAFAAVTVAQLAISFAYFGYFWSVQRGTPGMKLLGLQIGDESDGHSIDWNQALIRWLVLGIPSILASFASYISANLGFILSIVGLVWLIVLLYSIAQSPTKQGLHDRYARTIMVKTGRRTA